jgi:quercetin dioxygenase-like cupin family protein
MALPYHYISDLNLEVPEIKPDSIISRTLFADDHVKVILFGFAAGQELSEHTASVPAALHFIKGDAQLVMGEDQFEATAGSWSHMAANLSHSVYAKTDLLMLLLLFQT